MGTSFYFAVAVLIAILIGFVVTVLRINYFPRHRVVRDLLNKFWNIFCLGLYLRSYFELSHDVLINCLITLQTLNNSSTWGDYLSVVLAITNVII